MKRLGILLVAIFAAATVVADEIAVTVYNSNLGVVSEKRNLDFKRGLGQLAFEDVPSQIDASSVRFRSLDEDQQIAILEQNYVFDLVSPEQIYRKYIDEEIELFDQDGKLYSGMLIAFSKGEVTLKDKSGRIKIILMSNISEVNFPSLPDGLITRPTLFWKYSAELGGKIDCEVSYQTAGMNWNAEYVALLSSEETSLELSGWASINNTSGKTYQDATLKLIAGDIHRVQQTPRRSPMMKGLAADSFADGGFEEKKFFEYHLYTLPRKTTLANREIKQISLFEPSQSPVEKVFLFKPDRNPKKVEVAIKFWNSQESGLGMPLPGGRVRLFKADDDGSLILLGEDKIDHTPKDEEVNIKVGFAFDISAEETLVDQTRPSKLVEERTYEIEIRNHKSVDITVEVEKKFYGIWEILDSNIEYEKKDANTLIFHLPVASDGTAKINYRIRFQSR